MRVQNRELEATEEGGLSNSAGLVSQLRQNRHTEAKLNNHTWAIDSKD